MDYTTITDSTRFVLTPKGEAALASWRIPQPPRHPAPARFIPAPTDGATFVARVTETGTGNWTPEKLTALRSLWARDAGPEEFGLLLAALYVEHPLTDGATFEGELCLLMQAVALWERMTPNRAAG